MHVRAQVNELQTKGPFDAVGSPDLQAQRDQVRRKGFLPIKSIVPKKLNDKTDEYRAWKEDTADFFDTQLEGIGEFLINTVGKHEGSQE